MLHGNRVQLIDQPAEGIFLLAGQVMVDILRRKPQRRRTAHQQCAQRILFERLTVQLLLQIRTLLLQPHHLFVRGLRTILSRYRNDPRIPQHGLIMRDSLTTFCDHQRQETSRFRDRNVNRHTSLLRLKPVMLKDRRAVHKYGIVELAFAASTAVSQHRLKL